MSILCAAPCGRTAKLRLGAGWIACGVVAIAAATAGLAAPASADATAILKRTAAMYGGLKSYEGTVTVNESLQQGNKKANITSTQQVKYRAPNLFWVQTTQHGTGTGVRPGTQTNIAVSNGKEVFVYGSTQNKYMRQPTQPVIRLNQLLTGVLPDGNATGATQVSTTTVNGRPVYVLDVPPTLPAGLPAAQRTAILKQMKPIRYYIDRQTYHVLRVVRTVPIGTVSVDLASQTFNPSIPSTTFNFVPPAGATQIQRPAQGAVAPPGGPH